MACTKSHGFPQWFLEFVVVIFQVKMTFEISSSKCLIM
jgi:hypothetical protein